MNPGSKSGKSRNKFKKIFRILDNSNIQYTYKYTEKLKDAYIFSMQANREGYDAIIAVGGDGTINNVINGFYNDEGRKISDAAFGVIYTGTSPDFCKSYTIPLKLKDAVNTVIEGNKKKIKIGKIKFCSGKNKDGVRINEVQNSVVKYFACCANIGFGASLAQKANSGIRKYLGDFLGTFISMLAILPGYNPGNYSADINGRMQIVKRCYNLSVGITPLIASGIKVPKKNSMGNKFYVMGACNLKLKTIPGVIKKVYSGNPFENNENLWIDYTDKIEIVNNLNNPDVEFDGDPAGYLPCSIEFAKDDLEVFIP